METTRAEAHTHTHTPGDQQNPSASSNRIEIVLGGDILYARERYICHQGNCVSKVGARSWYQPAGRFLP